MSEAFGAGYADAYDALYLTKDYAAECNLVEQLFRTYGDAPIKGVLDLGCGTGNHAIILSQRDYEVVGVDSSPHMLVQARRKVAHLSTNGQLNFQQGDIRKIELGRQFDAVLIMFAVLGYQLDNVDVLLTLRTARQHLRSGGLLIFDVWYGPAVLRQRPSERVKVVKTERGQILRASGGRLDLNRQVCAINFHVWYLEGDQLVRTAEETHANRYFFPLELELFLQSAGFAPIRLGAFPQFDCDPDETTWNALQVARAI